MVALGSLAPGDPVPSVRDLARQLRVNPATVARAYQRLTEAGVFAVRRGEGTYIADVPTTVKKSERLERLRDAAIRYASASIAVGAGLEEATEELQASYDKLAGEQKRRPR